LRAQDPVSLAKQRDVVVHVFGNVKQSRRPERSWLEARVFECCADNMPETATSRIAGTLTAGFEQHSADVALLQCLADCTVTTSDVEQRTIDMHVAQRRNDTAIAVSEPKRFIFDLEARVVPPAREAQRMLALDTWSPDPSRVLNKSTPKSTEIQLMYLRDGHRYSVF
jgi:hypothetical protein